jgi:hypothetical protein
VADDQLDEVRLAIGEACARAVARHQRLGIRDAVQVSFTDGDRYLVRVTDHAAEVEQLDREDPLTLDVSVVLLQGLVKDLRMSPLEGVPGTEVRMGWPVKRRSR